MSDDHEISEDLTERVQFGSPNINNSLQSNEETS